MIIALFPNESKPHSFELASDIKDFLTRKGVTVVVEDDKVPKVGGNPLSSINPESIDFLFAMGGDGTLLRLTHRFKQINAPILGINLGHLGFMADIPIDDLYPSLTDFLEGRFSVTNRIALETENLYAVNDLVFHRGKNSSLIELAIRVDEIELNTFVADGIVIATPNGSTAYSLAAGGPILTPSLNAIVITPICPHTISNRPIVLTSDCKIEVEYLSDFESIEVSADGVNGIDLAPKQSLIIKRSEKMFRLVNLNRHEYFSTLRSKLGWSGKLKKSFNKNEAFHKTS